jgi:Tol biopolymer transport system component
MRGKRLVRAFAAGLLGAVLGAWNCGEGTVNNGDVSVITTIRISLGANGAEANEASYSPSISPDGRYVAFASRASNLHPDDTDSLSDVYVRDRVLGTTTLVSRAGGAAGAKGNAGSYAPSISDDGRYVVFESLANNIHPDDAIYSGGGGGPVPDPFRDIYVRDLQVNTTTLASRLSETGPGPTQDGPKLDFQCYSPAISSTGQYVAFNTMEPMQRQVHRRDVSGRILLSWPATSLENSSSPADEISWRTRLSISADGGRIAYSKLLDIGAGGTTVREIYSRDVATTESLVSAPPSAVVGTKAVRPSCSSDGRYVAFESDSITLLSAGVDSNGVADIFLRDTQGGTTTRVSVANSGVQGVGPSSFCSVSGDGTRICFVSSATNLVGGDTNGKDDVFLRDLNTLTTTRVSVQTFGGEAHERSGACAISRDGRYVVFESDATDMVNGDTNGATDIFIRGPLR